MHHMEMSLIRWQILRHKFDENTASDECTTLFLTTIACGEHIKEATRRVLSLPQPSSAWAWRGRAQAGGGWAWGNGTRETDPNSFLANSAMVNLLGLLEEALHENVFSQILIYKGQNDMAIWGRGGIENLKITTDVIDGCPTL